MFYPNLKFPKIAGRPFFYTNFVTTVDGKVGVKKEALPASRQGYWPIGSKQDYEVLTELRAYADCLIQGGNLAREFGQLTLKSLSTSKFIALRKKLNKNPNLPYYIMSRNSVTHPMWNRTVVSGDDPESLAKLLYKKGYRDVLIEGGPTIFTSFLKKNLIDEIFLTIAPKIYGNEPGKTLTLVEGYLFPKIGIKKLRLLSFKSIGNELFLRYRVIN